MNSSTYFDYNALGSSDFVCINPRNEIRIVINAKRLRFAGSLDSE